VLIGLIITLAPTLATAQQSLLTTGATAVSEEGSVSYAIGEVFYTSVSTSEYNLSHGIQQDYRIIDIPTYTDHEQVMTLVASPNPTPDILYLSVENSASNSQTSLRYDLINANGYRVEGAKLQENQTTIDMQKYASGYYLLRIYDAKQNIKTFKIIKQ